MRHAFPNFVGPRGRLQETVNAVRLFRNRIAHHEPIFGRNLVRDHDRIVRIGGYIHASCASYIDSHSRVAEVLGRRKRAVDFGYSTRF